MRNNNASRFNLTIELLIFSSGSPGDYGSPGSPVSISQLSFLSFQVFVAKCAFAIWFLFQSHNWASYLFKLSKKCVAWSHWVCFNLTIELLIFSSHVSKWHSMGFWRSFNLTIELLIFSSCTLVWSFLKWYKARFQSHNWASYLFKASGFVAGVIARNDVSISQLSFLSFQERLFRKRHPAGIAFQSHNWASYLFKMNI